MIPPTENSAALFGWHSQDSRATGPLDTADTVTAHYGTGGGNTPLIVQPCICIQGSMIGRAEKNGPQGDGLNQEVCFTLNTVDEHAVAYTFAEQNYSEYVLSPAGGTIKANGGATGGGGETLVTHNQPHYIVRRLMPLECSRLQGFPAGLRDSYFIRDKADYPEFRNNQTLSIAGRRKGLKGQKSSLFWEAIRIASEMLAATGGRYPRFVIWENVYGALSSNGGDDFEIVLNELLHLTGSNEFIRQHGIWGGLCRVWRSCLPCCRCEILGSAPASQTCLCCR